MLRKSISAGLAAILAVSASVPTATTADARNRGGKIAAGIALGIAAGALIANSRRSHADDGYYVRRSGEYNRCERWAWKCDRGNDWACEKFDRNC